MTAGYASTLIRNIARIGQNMGITVKIGKGGMVKMKICPKCGRSFDRLLALSRRDNKTMICDECATKEALDDAGILEGNPDREYILDSIYQRRTTPQERTRSAVYATGNKWAIENFNDTHK